MTSAQNHPQEFSPTDSRWQDLRRTGRFILPIVFTIFLILMYANGYVALHSEEWIPRELSPFSINVLLLRILVVILLPGVAGILGILFIFKQAGKFILSVYQPKTDEELSAHIRRKLLGVPPVPPPLDTVVKYPSVVIEYPVLDQGHWARWFGGPANLIIYDGSALYLERGNQFSRVVGPGIPKQLLERHERIREVVDLRPQTKSGSAEAWTKDGIRVKLTLSAEVQINASSEAAAQPSKLRYPFDPAAVRMAVEWTAVLATTDRSLQERLWLGRAWNTVTGAIEGFVAGHSLDELFLAPQAENHTNSNHQKILTIEAIEQIFSRRISEQVINGIQTSLNRNGVKILGLQITKVELHEKVGSLRTEYWEAIKRKISAQRDSMAEAEHIRAREQAHADAQRTMLMTIIKRLENIPPDQLTESLVLSLSNILDQGLEDPIVRQLIAKESFAVLERMRKLLNEKF